jgi:PIN domain nuclease of toxin-antitoxin system
VTGRLILDTCAVLWLGGGAPILRTASEAITAATGSGMLFVHPMSAWEVGMLTSRSRVRLSLEPRRWFDQFLTLTGAQMLAAEPGTMIDASFLPEATLRDPTDRMIVAAARATGAAIVTRDKPILDYAAQGHVRAVAC